MIDLTPLDVRNKRGDFKKALRGYEPQDVDGFLELVAERLEALVRETLQLRERSETLAQQVNSQSGRERAVQEALVTAQELRADIRAQAQREAELILEEANAAARRKVSEADTDARAKLRQIEARLEQSRAAVEDMERRRARFLKSYRQLLEREMDVVEVEQGRAPYDDRAIDLDLAQSREEAPGIDVEEDAPEPAAAGAPSADGDPPPSGADDEPEPLAFDSALAEAAVDRVFRVADFDPVQVDHSAEERPPFDAPVDRLAAAYGTEESDPADEGGDGGAAGPDASAAHGTVEGAAEGADEPSKSSDGGLFRLPDLPPPDAGEDPRWG